MVAGIVIEHRKTINPKDDVVDSTEVDISAFVIASEIIEKIDKSNNIFKNVQKQRIYNLFIRCFCIK